MDVLPSQVTGLILAGGRASRMGGMDKGLQLLDGIPLAQRVLQRLWPQVGQAMISANRHLDAYRGFGCVVWPDTLPDYPGPLAGFVTGLRHCATPWLVTVPCDAPHFPCDLVARLALAVRDGGTRMACAATPDRDTDGRVRWQMQPTFCLLAADLLPALESFVAGGGRAIRKWAERQAAREVRFEDPRAFANLNTLADLQAMQS